MERLSVKLNGKSTEEAHNQQKKKQKKYSLTSRVKGLVSVDQLVNGLRQGLVLSNVSIGKIVVVAIVLIIG